jgi:hypothetical protein
MAAYLKGLAEQEKQQLHLHREEIEAFMLLARKKGISLSDDSFGYVQTIGIVASAPKLVERLLAPMPRERDELLPFEWLTQNARECRQPGYVRHEHFTLMAHPHFRRALHGMNGFAPRFVDVFWGHGGPGVQKFVAIDEDRVKLNTGGYIVELDTWFGAPFNEDVSKIPNGITKLKPPSELSGSHVSMFFADSHCFDVKWSGDGSVRTFQALEIKSEKSRVELGGEMFYPARYAHAEFDVARGSFRHFDGAMQYFTESEYLGRRDSDFNYNAKNREQIKSRSKKLFKLNGTVNTADWVDLCCHFFAQNPLAYEYFGGRYPNHVTEVLERIRGL